MGKPTKESPLSFLRPAQSTTVQWLALSAATVVLGGTLVFFVVAGGPGEARVVEAETAVLSGSMVVGEDPEASGGEFVHLSRSSAPGVGHSRALFCFDIADEGTYELAARVLGPTPDDASFYLSVGSVARGVWEFPDSTTYDERVVVFEGSDATEFEVPQGALLVEVYASEPGARIDWLSIRSASGGPAPEVCDHDELRSTESDQQTDGSLTEAAEPTSSETTTSTTIPATTSTTVPPSPPTAIPDTTTTTTTTTTLAPTPLAATPGTTTTTQATVTEEPAKKAEEPAKKAEEPAKKAEEPAKKKAEEPAKKKAEEPAKKAEEPAKKAEEPVKKKAEEPAKKKAEDTVGPQRIEGGSYGAGRVGPGQEARSANGVVAQPSDYRTKIQQASSGQTVLLKAGTYNGGFNVPNGVTVKPYDGATVMIKGSITMDSNSVLAGLTIQGTGQWAVEVEGTSATKKNITIRNNRITGGTVETVRVSRNVEGALILGNDFPNGSGNHIIKFHHEYTAQSPSGSIVGNLIGAPSKGDGIQIQTHGSVLVDGNTFTWAPENNLDIKAGSITVRNNLFVNSNQGALLVHHDGNADVHNNRFAGGKNIALGSKNTGKPTWRLHENLIEGGQISLRKSFGPAIVEGNTMVGGQVKVGFSGDDYPRDPRLFDNYFEGTDLVDRTSSHGVEWQCSGNRLVDVSGDWDGCG